VNLCACGAALYGRPHGPCIECELRAAARPDPRHIPRLGARLLRGLPVGGLRVAITTAAPTFDVFLAIAREPLFRIHLGSFSDAADALHFWFECESADEHTFRNIVLACTKALRTSPSPELLRKREIASVTTMLTHAGLLTKAESIAAMKEALT
jgi:hypothetical protein